MCTFYFMRNLVNLVIPLPTIGGITPYELELFIIHCFFLDLSIAQQPASAFAYWSGNWNASTSANFCMSTVFRCTVLAMYHLLLLWVTSPSAMGNQPHLLLLWVTSPFAMGSQPHLLLRWVTSPIAMGNQPHSYAQKQVIALGNQPHFSWVTSPIATSIA